MATSCWFSILIVAMVAGSPPAHPGTSGLSCRHDGVLLKDGEPYRGIGVNYFDAFARTLKDPNDTSYDAGFRVLAKHRIPFARFMCTGFWPVEMRLYKEDKQAYFKLLDGVVLSAQRHGVGLIPSLFWHMPTVPDLAGEPCDQWGNPESKTHEFMRNYVREVVTRYQGSPAIWGWEFGNEYNLAADLPNARDHLPPIVPQLGTPQTRSDRDILTHEMIRTAFREFAKEVRKYDRTRIVCTGNSIPRTSAWHQMHEDTWAKDSPEQFAEMLTGDNPNPTDTISVHIYADAADRLAEALRAARRVGKPLFVGEFGDPGEGPEANERFAALLHHVEELEVPLAALWVFDYAGQTEWSVRQDNSRGYQLQAIAEANRRIRPISEMPAEVLRDKIRSGLLGQILGNLNGLPHEMKYTPAQTMQLFTTMIALGFIEDDTNMLLDGGLRGIDPNCAIAQIVGDVREWHRQYPNDWRTTRKLLKDKYSRLIDEIVQGIARPSSKQEQARATYYAICLDLAASLRQEYPQSWPDALAALSGCENVVQVIYHRHPENRKQRLR